MNPFLAFILGVSMFLLVLTYVSPPKTVTPVEGRITAVEEELKTQEEQIRAIVKILEMHREELKKTRAIGVSR